MLISKLFNYTSGDSPSLGHGIISVNGSLINFSSSTINKRVASENWNVFLVGDVPGISKAISASM